MPRQVVEYRCLIISPGDVADERAAISDVLQRWNASVGVNYGVRIEAVRWETHIHPDMSGPAQEKVNEQIVDDCDFGIAVFWSRVGTPTEAYDSGSVEEMERLIARGAKVMLYCSSRPIPLEKMDLEQLQRLQDLAKRYQERRLLGQFSNIGELREMVNKDLTLLLGKEIRGAELGGPGGVETAKRPDIRVKTSAAITAMPDGVTSMFMINVENHSPHKFFLSSVSLKLSNGNGLWFPRDSVLKTPNSAQVIEPGDSYEFHILPSDFKNVDVESIVCAVAHDKIDRVFNSDAEETKKAIKAVVGRHERIMKKT